MFPKAINEARKWCKTHNIPDDHGMKHAFDVTQHACIGLRDFDLSKENKVCVILAALLHDIEDRKFVESVDYEGTRGILDRIGLDPTLKEFVIIMITLVSCSKNGNTVDKSIPSWYYIPRDADRLEALGKIGIVRAYETTLGFAKKKSIEPVFWTDSTIRCKNLAELEQVASPERFKKYTENFQSESLIDHFYDKLLHIHILSSGSPRLNKIAELRRGTMIEFILDFGVTGKIDWLSWGINV